MHPNDTPRESVFIVTMHEVESSWVAGAYQTEHLARYAARTASASALELSLSQHHWEDDINGAYWLTPSAVVREVPLNASPQYDGYGDDHKHVATYRYGIDAGTSEYSEKYDPNGYPKGGVR